MDNNSDGSKTTGELLREFAAQTKREVWLEEIPYPSSAIQQVKHHKKMLYIPNGKDRKSILVAFHDHKCLDSKELYFGVFIPLFLPNIQKLLIRERNVLDRLNPFLKKHTLSTGHSHFDSHTVVTGNDEPLLRRLFGDSETQNEVIESLKLMVGMYVGINEVNLDFAPAFWGKSNLGIFTTQAWIVDADLIEALYAKAEILYKLVAKKHGMSSDIASVY